jgi:hypothetical protein
LPWSLIPFRMILKWINPIQNQLFSDFPYPTVHALRTVPDEQIHRLPNDYAEDGIAVDGKPMILFYKERMLMRINRLFIQWCRVPCSLIHHLPDLKCLCTLHRARPMPLTVEDLDAVAVAPFVGCYTTNYPIQLEQKDEFTLTWVKQP